MSDHGIMPVTLSFNPITRCATKMGPSSPTPLQQWCKSTVVTLIGLSNLDKVNVDLYYSVSDLFFFLF